MEDFDSVPKPETVPYKYYAPLPKKKSERKKLPAQPCRSCERYYDSFPDAEERARGSCRHRGKNKRPPTPEHYWDLDFPSYDIPLKKYAPKPLWQNKYHDTLNLDRKLYEGLNVRLVPYFDAETSQSTFEALEKEIVYLPASRSSFVKGNVNRAVPRKVAAYGEEGVKYTFSGNSYAAKPWTDTLVRLRDAAFELTGTTYNFVLVNRYRNGRDYIGCHKDDERDLDRKSSIVSFSFGAERKFVFKRRHFPDFETTLPSGSALMMKPPTNKYWFHSLPEQKEVEGVRINLTFRVILKT